MCIRDRELGSVPAPIVEIKCTSQELCFPKFGGVFVNPTSRLALKGTCLEECKGTEVYHWDVYQDSIGRSPLNVVRMLINTEISNGVYFA